MPGVCPWLPLPPCPCIVSPGSQNQPSLGKDKSTGFRSGQNWDRVSAQPTTSCVALSKLLCLSEPLFSNLLKMYVNTCLQGCGDWKEYVLRIWCITDTQSM